MDGQLTGKHLTALTGISRATLYNYVGMGLLPAPDVRAPDDAGDDPGGRARRIGYFPASAVEDILRIKALKRKGWSMNKIIEQMGDADGALGQDGAPGPAPYSDARHGDDGKMPAEGVPFFNQGNRLTIDNVDDAAYMVNNRFEVTWSNALADREFFGQAGGMPKDITECNVFRLALNWQKIAAAADLDEILRFHVAAAKNRLPRQEVYTLGAYIEGAHVDALLDAYDAVEPAPRGALQHTRVNLAPEGEAPEWFTLYASFFREGIFFVYQPAQSPSEQLLELLGRRDIVIRELLRKRRPHLTPLAVLVADLQDSVKICAELPPEEYFELINQLWSTMEPILRRFHATHGKHVGDGMLYYFFPQPDCQYVMNAVECARAMQLAMVDVSRQWRERKNWANDLKLNIGIDEGQEWFGAYQTSTHLEFTVLGDTVNRAARLSDFAHSGTTWGTKNLIGTLGQSERDRVRYGIHRDGGGDARIFVAATFSRISNLVNLEEPKNLKLRDLGALPVTEITHVEAAAKK